jgi:transposase
MRYVRDLTDDEREELERMAQQEVGRVALRAQMILLSSRGYSVPQLEAIQQVTNVTIYKWLDRFEELGPEGLHDEERSGRPPKMDATAMQVLEEAVAQSPTDLGYEFTVWTLPLLASHLKEQLGLAVSIETVRQALKELDYCWSRPRWLAPAADEAQQQAVQAQIDAVPTDDTLLYIDETECKRLPVLRGMWMRCGQQKRIPAVKDNDKFALYGAFNPTTGEMIHQRFDRAVSAHTVCFLQQIAETFPEGSITLVWDQASFHTSRIVEEWLSEHPRFHVILLPTASPQMNPVEDLWRHLKQRVAANLNRSLDALAAACQRFFQQRSTDDLKRMAGVNSNS